MVKYNRVATQTTEKNSGATVETVTWDFVFGLADMNLTIWSRFLYRMVDLEAYRCSIASTGFPEASGVTFSPSESAAMVVLLDGCSLSRISSILGLQITGYGTVY